MKDQKKEIIIAIAILILSILAFLLSGEKRSSIPDGRITLSDTEDTYLTVDIESGGYVIEGYELLINKPDITEESFEKIVSEHENQFIARMLGGENDTENVTRSLNLYERYDDLPFEFLWFVNDSTYLSESGEILCAEEFDTTIDLIISYKSFSYDLSIPIHVNPCETEIGRIRNRNIRNDLISEISKRINAVITSEKQDLLELPTDVNGNKVNYYKSGEPKKNIYLLLGPTAVFFIHIAFIKDRKKSKDEELEAIMSEYPTMLQKVSLYVSSGMTIRNVWAKMCEESKGTEKEKHPLYKEMQITLNELNNGIPESTAYIRFGERIKKSEIVRFTALLSQNIKKGSTRLSELLENEARNAFVDKKNRARKQGEKMGTKLLFPMMILLMDTIVIIMIPAFWSL